MSSSRSAMETTGKKAVRFSSPFEINSNTIKTKTHNIEKIADSSTQRRVSSNHQSKSIAGKPSDRESFSGDSWDAFDQKMLKTTGTGKVSKKIQEQFVELSFSQNKSLNIDDNDFEAISFQDAKGLLERDEKERLQFMNSNVSFSEGIDQVEAPSLLSVTNYFQQGSSFPVPYVGNDSTMMFGESFPGIARGNFQSSSHRRSSSQSHRLSSRPTSENLSQNFNSSDFPPTGLERTKNDVSRKDSLAKFFLGSESNGMNKIDIMEYVIDYCKRRASYSFSDASDCDRQQKSTETTPEKHDSGIEVEKQPVANPEEKKATAAEERRRSTRGEIVSQTEMKSLGQNCSNAVKPNNSVMLADGASIKDAVLNVSDVGSIDGFEKFKKNLHLRRNKDDRYRSKIKHHEQFEKKRLNVDERYSHPRLSPKAFSGPGATASLERPRKLMMCSSPPEKLPRPRRQNVASESHSPNVVPTSDDSGGQCHSTPVANEAYVAKFTKTTRIKDETKFKSSKEEAVDDCNVDYKKQKVAHENVTREAKHNNTSENQYESSIENQGKALKLEDDKTSNSQRQVVRPTSITTEPSKILKPQNLLTEGFSIMPVIHSGIQQHITGQQQCSCPHNCGQQSNPMVSGVPIVIHIHLPSMPSSGSIGHPVSTPTFGD